MDNKISGSGNVTWLRILDEGTELIRAVWMPSGRPQNVTGTPRAIVLRDVPMLDWPSKLFADVAVAYH